MTGFDTADLRVPPICDELDLSAETRDAAVDLAARADMEHPINRTPAVVAAGAVYAAALLTNEKRTQNAVADAAGVSVVAIRDTYTELLEHEGYEMPGSDDTDGDGNATAAAPEDPTGGGPGLVIKLLGVGVKLLVVGVMVVAYRIDGQQLISETLADGTFMQAAETAVSGPMLLAAFGVTVVAVLVMIAAALRGDA